MKESLICFCIYLFSILCIDLFLFLFYIFLFLFDIFLFLFDMNLSARRICVHNCFLFLLYGAARSRDRTTFCIPLLFIFLSLNSPPLEWLRSQNTGMWQTLIFRLMKALFLLGWKFWQHLFYWAIIIFFLIECYVRAFWIFYVEFVFQNRLTFSQFLWNW